MKSSSINLNISNSKLIAILSVYLVPLITNILNQNLSLLSTNFSIACNTLSVMIQAPLMLIILVAFTEDKILNFFIGLTLTLLLAFSSVALAGWGVNEKSLAIILMTGSIAVFSFATMIFIKYIKRSLGEKKEIKATVILSGIIFAFGSYFALLSLNMIKPQKHAEDIWMLLGLVTVISASLIGITISLYKLSYSNHTIVTSIKINQKGEAFALPGERFPLRAIQ
jgi:hypothetical protein